MPANNSTKEVVAIADIQEEMVMLKNGSMRAVIESSAINFELRSADEQLAIIQNFQNFLNSLDFPIQIIVSSRRLDLAEYTKKLDEVVNSLTNELLKVQAIEYAKYVSELSEMQNIMSKRFYIVVPFVLSQQEESKPGILDSFKGLLKKSGPQRIEAKNLTEAQEQLMQRADLVFSSLVALGMKAKLLKGPELMSLFYELYNPGTKIDFKNIAQENITQ